MLNLCNDREQQTAMTTLTLSNQNETYLQDPRSEE